MPSLVFLCVLLVSFVLFVLYLVQGALCQMKAREYEEIRQLTREIEALQKEKESVQAQKAQIERQARDSFTLYEITKEITKKLNEQDAFEVFRTALKDNVAFEDCRLVHSEGDRRREIKEEEGYFIYGIEGRQRKLGQIAIKGLKDEDRDKFTILAQQFGLALQRVKLYQEVEKLATTDSLTGVHTRRYLLERFEEELKRAETRKNPLTFLMIDIDFFKKFNDKHGHLVGDQILRSVGLLIQQHIRGIDFAGRYGGEEFCVVLPDTEFQGGFFVAERVRLAIHEAIIQAYDASLKVTVSLGLSCFPTHGRTSMELIDKADWALYRSKNRGRNCTTVFGSSFK